MPLVTRSSAEASSTSQTPASRPAGARSAMRTWAASGAAPAGAAVSASPGRPTCSAPPSASADSSSASAAARSSAQARRCAALQRGGHRELVARLRLDQRERERGAPAHELGQRGRDAVGPLDGRGQRLGPGGCGSRRRGGLGREPLRLPHATAQVVDAGAGAALGGQRRLVRGARRDCGGLRLRQCRLGRRELVAAAHGRPGELLAALGALRGARALRGQRGFGVRGRARQLGRGAACRQRRLAALAGACGGRRQLALVDRGERRLGCAQALGRLDRGFRLKPKRRGLGREPVGQLALPRRLGRDVGQALRERLAARAQALDGRGQRDAVRRSLFLLAQDAGELALGLRAAGGDLGQAGGGRVALGAGGGQIVLALAARSPRLGQCRGQQAQARLGDLAPERLGALGGRGLQLERAQAGAQLALDVARALEIGRDARELGLGALPPPLELAQPGGLLDQAAALVRAAPAAPDRRCPAR